MWRDQPASPTSSPHDPPSQPQRLPSAAMQRHSTVRSPLGTEGKTSGNVHTAFGDSPVRDPGSHGRSKLRPERRPKPLLYDDFYWKIIERLYTPLSPCCLFFSSASGFHSYEKLCSVLLCHCRISSCQLWARQAPCCLQPSLSPARSVVWRTTLSFIYI